ncbi:Dyp-type peroxidase [Mariprofundus erugo]|uniref:Dyp-type peroxidase n=1 Tax=Mariprofundus erugo TaxID=2528639 RepID=A0A5R9GLC4_9PROT|nr:Dyp-type peroxidase [Mariprofundus erugo]TLS66930.1 Dyp-type peroxidase [Mariprofundus erugo]
MINVQRGILADVPQVGRHLLFSLMPGHDLRPALQAISELADGETVVVGLGQSLVLAMGYDLAELRVFPPVAGQGFEVPSTPAALWCWLRGDDRGALLHIGRRVEHALAPALCLTDSVDVFMFDGGRDLSGYEDGTENPVGEKMADVAIVSGAGAGMDGSSFVAVQQWLHDFSRLEKMSALERDHVIGRYRDSNEEIDDAPASAHVKRTAQESFDPEAFILRRSMPWSRGQQGGLVFVAFARSFDPFEMLLRRMVGADDGVVDGLFGFTRPLSGCYFWCPPMHRGRLDLRALS